MTPCKPKRSPLSEMTCPASATAVFSLLPVPSRIASNSALESASGPSDNGRSRGLSSGGSCLIVYLRPCTSVFYIIQVTGIRIQLSAASALMRVSSNSALLRGARTERQAGQRRVELGLRSLLGAMYLQLAWRITSRRCEAPGCSNIIGLHERSNKKTCNRTCKERRKYHRDRAATK